MFSFFCPCFYLLFVNEKHIEFNEMCYKNKIAITDVRLHPAIERNRKQHHNNLKT